MVPYWPQANGEVERQNRTLLKRLRIGQCIRGEWKTELRTFLMAYNSTPHSITNKSPNHLMGREIRTKIPSLQDVETNPIREQVVERDYQLKMKGKKRVDEVRKARSNDIQVGDKVIQKHMFKENKLTTTFDGKEFDVVDKQGPVVTLSNQDTGEQYDHIVTHVKKVSKEIPSTIEDKNATGSDMMDEGGGQRSRRIIKVPTRYRT